MATLIVDVTYPRDAEGEGEERALGAVLGELTAGTTVTYAVMRRHGPGGGWPEVMFEGDHAEIDLVARRYAGPEATQMDVLDVISMITE